MFGGFHIVDFDLSLGCPFLGRLQDVLIKQDVFCTQVNKECTYLLNLVSLVVSVDK